MPTPEPRYEVTVEQTVPSVAVEETVYQVTVEEPAPTQVTVTVAGSREPTAHLFVWNDPGDLFVREGDGRLPIPVNATMGGISGAVKDAPEGADIIVDVNINGVTVWTDQTKRLRILDGETESVEFTDIDLPALTVGDIMSIDIDQVGSDLPGTNLTITIRYHIA